MNIYTAITQFIKHIRENNQNASAENKIWTIQLFEDYLAHFSGLNKEKSEFTQGDNKVKDEIGSITQKHVNEFLHIFVIKRVASNEKEMKTYLSVLSDFISWLSGKRIIDINKQNELNNAVNSASALPLIPKITDLLFEIADENGETECSESIESAFKVQINEKKIILQDLNNKTVNYDLSVPQKLAKELKNGMILNIAIGKTRYGWIIKHAGNVFLIDINEMNTEI